MLEGNQALDSNSRFRRPPGLDSGVVASIENVVSTVNLGSTLDLKAIALRAPHAEYDPEKCAGVRMKESKTTATIFSSGKTVYSGAKSEKQSLLAARKHARIIRNLGFNVKFKDFKIQNMAAVYDFTFPLDLTRLAYSHYCKYSLYEPELFPGLIHRMKQSKIMVAVFSSGKITIAGTQKRDEIFEAFKIIYPILKSFRIVKQKELMNT